MGRHSREEIRSRGGLFERNCPTIKGIINKISGENRIVAEDVSEMVEHFHMFALDAMSSDTVPTFKIPNFGNFFISSVKCKLKINFAIKMYRKGTYSYEKTCEVIKRFYPIFKRAHFEELKRGKGVTTNKKGRNRKSLGKLLGKKLREKWKQT